ncbi:MAG: DUF4038 domain-containing protein [Thermoproteota archaeon]
MFETEDSVDYYNAAFETVKKISPGSLTTMHLAGGLWQVPEVFVKSPNYDFYMYQSGHTREHQHLPYELAQRFYNMPVKRPIVNGEPCYEGIGSIGSYGKHGRFNSFDVRKAVWQSLLSGAKAGVTYGAHGVWSWQEEGGNLKYPEEYASIYGDPYHWRIALRFSGAFDVAFCKWFFEKYDLFDITPANEKLVNNTSEIRVSEDEDKILIYTPFNTEIRLKTDEAYSKWEGIDLGSRRIFKPEVEREENCFTIRMTEFNSDLLIIGSQKRK